MSRKKPKEDPAGGTASPAGASYPTLTLVGIGVAAALSLYGALQLQQVLSVPSQFTRDPYQVKQFDDVFGDLRATLPENETVGFLIDTPPDDARTSMFFLKTRYALAPRLVVPAAHGTRARWVVGEFTQKPDLERLRAEHGLTVARDFGGGLILFQREGR